MADSGQSKTENATPHKLKKAKEKGQISRSMDFSALAGLGIILLAVVFVIPGILLHLSVALVETFKAAPYAKIEDLGLIVYSLSEVFIIAIAPIFLLALVVGISVNFSQTKGVFSFFPLTPDIKKLNPISGFKKLFSVKSLVELIKNVLRLSAVALLIYYMFNQEISILALNFNLNPMDGLAKMYDLMVKTIILYILIMLPFVLSDVIFQKWFFLKEMRMSKQEVQDEYKNQDGDPAVKSKRRKLQNELREKANSLAVVPQSDVVVTNPTFLAVALRFDRESMVAPKVISKGKGGFAHSIRSIAKDNKILMKQDVKLARAIYKTTNINSEIPPELYDDVAKLYRWVYSH
ncbi:EscU/YscU/HrcU family type III secretion system export apparatus switch protein [Motilimonas cestriensis]|uniref:Flagellar biosynthetic protein FlhB n=1 Tax=Motilimonas cestriensis TaxID=2742685 RepID=A0ABS8WFJ8_9GAMM|nr:EscU/YscU/HrcU family type III secretion system export apparatus switch protein [Motilimonas cestriensis]MCE2597107.1 EscU/YscU/HrcU family type III secretion system export apparatus switch protein [Motilimonas cestriensis]